MISKKNSRLVLTTLIIVVSIVSCKPTHNANLKAFNISDVRILDGPFLNAQQVDLKYVLALDVDRLLAPFLKNAGIPPLKENYGNWESSGLDGHIGGHYLSALSLMYEATGNEELLRRLNYMLDWLDKCQQKSGSGYVDGIPNGPAFWEDFASGNTLAVRERWVPLYNIHKLFAGLYDAYRLTGSQKAYVILIKLTDWFYGISEKLTDEQVQEILRREHGGLNETFAEIAEITGDKKYLNLAIKFSHRSILDPLIDHKNQLDGKHANTIIPKIIGFKYIADAAEKPDWDSASVFFWNTVMDNWTIAIGGNSVREHFHDHNDFSIMVEHNQGPESCNTYNMLKLTELLYLSDPQTKYMDYYEKAVFNHILSTQNPTKGGFVYFTPMRPRHYRVYSQPQESFWCCVGTGLENHAKYGEMIYAHDDANLYVNLFIASKLNWKDRGIEVTQETKFPYEDFSTLKLYTEVPVKMGIKIRKPAWLIEDELKIHINNEPFEAYDIKDNYIVLSRKWRNGDEVKINMPKHINLEYLPDGSSWAAIKYGPIVLAAISDSTNLDGLFANSERWAHVASGPLYPRSEGPTIISDEKDFSNAVKPLDIKHLTFKMSDLIYPDKFKDLVLRPFYEIHEARYIVYWPVATQQEFEAQKDELARKEKAMIALEERTIDQVGPGEQQPEVEHNFKGENTNTGITIGEHWRNASGWFSFDLYDKKQEAQTLQITYFGFDRKKEFNIYLNDILLASENFTLEKGDKLYSINYDITEEVKKTNSGKLTVKFEAVNKRQTAGIYYIRLLR